jgi:hypothetical protein
VPQVNHGLAMVVAATPPLVAAPPETVETPTTPETSKTCSPPSTKSNSKETEVEGQTWATHIYQTRGQTQTQAQKETHTHTVEPPDCQKLHHQGHSPHGDMRAH